ncbi:hypothetical protein [Flavobacterium sp. 3HN19-14]|uniref:hypothetical protein n=1 Tax=Flavobacterium sp. 3HN19-14 TaxID=3448133 RepID=UPI003EE014C7
MMQHLLPAWFIDNRADVLERTFSESTSDYQGKGNSDVLRDYYQMPYSQIIDTSGDLPILYITTTQVNNGYPGVISSVKMDKTYKGQRTDVLSLIDSMKVKRDRKDNRISNKNPRTDIRFSTAAVMSSRFPYVSPAGKLFDRYFVDGGYFDNSGAGTMLEFMEQLSDFLTKNEANPVYKRFKFHILHLTNSEVNPKPVRDISPLTNDLAAPLLTLAGMQGSSTSISDGLLKQYFSRQFYAKDTDNNTAYIKYSLYNPKYVDTIANHKYDHEPEYPMSWAISDYHFKRMEAALNREYNSNIDKVKF